MPMMKRKIGGWDIGSKKSDGRKGIKKKYSDLGRKKAGRL